MTQQDEERGLSFLELNDRGKKPRVVGITEIRGPYYTVVGPLQLTDVLDVAGSYVDWFKVPAPSLALLERRKLERFVAICHDHDVLVSAGGIVEALLPRGPKSVNQYFSALIDYGFDIVEISAGMLAISASDYLRLVENAKKTGLKVKAEVGIQFGAGGTTSAAELEAEGTGDLTWAVRRAKAALETGADMVLLESEGVTESVREWRTDVPSRLASELGPERVMFEAADPAVFEWYVKSFGPEVNLFVDHSQVLQLEALRSGIWGTKSLFGRVVTYKG